MKIAILADIHGNLPALQTVVDDMDAWAPDLVVMGGDMVNRGPQPRACVDLVLDRVAHDGWQAIKGNHEDFVLSHRDEELPGEGPAFEIRRNSYWSYLQLNGQLDALAALPDEWQSGEPAGAALRVVHASMIDNRTGIYHKNSDDDLRRKIAPAPAVFAAGHTHRPLVRWVDETLVVNVGAVGSPFDDDWRASYARLTHADDGWSAEIVRLPYDRAATDRLFFETGFIEEGGDLTRIMLAELRLARSLVYGWIGEYQDAVLAGDLGFSESVDAYLAACGVPVP